MRPAVFPIWLLAANRRVAPLSTWIEPGAKEFAVLLAMLIVPPPSFVTNV
jgi:hypothetical protein